MNSFLGFFLLLGNSLVFFPDLVELLHVFKEIWTSLQSDEQLGLLAIASVALNSDGLGLDLLEGGVLVSTQDELTWLLT